MKRTSNIVLRLRCAWVDFVRKNIRHDDAVACGAPPLLLRGARTRHSFICSNGNAARAYVMRKRAVCEYRDNTAIQTVQEMGWQIILLLLDMTKKKCYGLADRKALFPCHIR